MSTQENTKGAFSFNYKVEPKSSVTPEIPFNISGVAYVRAINSPKYFEKMAKRIYDIFEHQDALDAVTRIVFNKEANTEKETYVTPAIANMAKNIMSEYAITGGIRIDFLSCKVEADLNEPFTMIHDIVSEITIRDGIVTKIEPANINRAYGLNVPKTQKVMFKNKNSRAKK